VVARTRGSLNPEASKPTKGSRPTLKPARSSSNRQRYTPAGKAAQFPSEGGAVILVIDGVPDDVLTAANPDGFFPLEHGLVQFDLGAGLEELLAVWPSLSKHIRDVEDV